MRDIGNSILLEDDGGGLLLEDGSGILLLESAPVALALNNYEFVRVADGMSTSEKIR